MRHLAVYAILALALGGCASSKSDQRYSVFPPHARACAFAANGALMKLATGESCLAHVDAKQRISLTAVRVDRCENYLVAVPPGQYWDDAGRVNRPPKGEDGSIFMNLAKPFKRVQDAQWSALIGTAVDIGTVSTSHFDQDLSDRPVLSIARSGQLGFYPNDAIMPWTGNYFYSNNGGEIWVHVTRTGDTCP